MDVEEGLVLGKGLEPGVGGDALVEGAMGRFSQSIVEMGLPCEEE